MKKEFSAAISKDVANIDRAPDSFEAVVVYGTVPLAELGKISKEMLDIQNRFNDLVDNVGKTLESSLGPLSGMLDKSMDAATIKQGGKNLDAIRTEFENLDADIKQIIKDAEKLGDRRTEATLQLREHIDASAKVLKRYNKKYILAVAKDYGKTENPADRVRLEDVIKRKEDFADRIAILEGTSVQSDVAAKQLDRIVATMEDQSKKMQDIINNSIPEWKAMLSAADTFLKSVGTPYVPKARKKPGGPTP